MQGNRCQAEVLEEVGKEVTIVWVLKHEYESTESEKWSEGTPSQDIGVSTDTWEKSPRSCICLTSVPNTK